jgi:CxxC-x17-CxxC domain-containing protein
MEFQDRALQCVDCKQEFIFTAGEQEFYERKGFREQPKRCKPCREARKTRREGGGGDYGNGGGGGGRGREMFETTCASCGAPAKVPFKPQAGRPVYCKDCYGNRQGQGSGLGG